MVMAHIFLPTVAVSLLDTLRMANKMEKAYSIQIYKIKKLKFMRVNGKMEWEMVREYIITQKIAYTMALGLIIKEMARMVYIFANLEDIKEIGKMGLWAVMANSIISKPTPNTLALSLIMSLFQAKLFTQMETSTKAKPSMVLGMILMDLILIWIHLIKLPM